MEHDPEFLRQLSETFSSELDEQSEIIIRGLLTLEKNKLNDEKRQATLTDIFRAAHNIKGTSRSLGLNNISEIAHHLESIFDAIRADSLQIDAKLIDSCLDAVDKMSLLMKAHLDKQTPGFDVNALIKNLDVFAPLKTAENKKSTPAPAVQQPTAKLVAAKAQKIKEETATKSIRIPIENIERLSSLMEELQASKIAIDDHYAELARLNAETTKLTEMNEENVADLTKTISDLYRNMRANIKDLKLISDSLQEETRMLRLVPIATFLSTLPRYVRDLSQELNKKVELVVTGGDVKIDKLMLEKLKDPLIHLVRNSIDHGIEDPEKRKALGKPETGTIYIDITEESGLIKIKVKDDGQGIDIKRIAETARYKNLVTEDELKLMNDKAILDLIFKPGFSTKEIITTISGRGVGLDVVKTNIENMGTLDITTEVGSGTTVTIFVPFTLSSERGLMIAIGNQYYVIPTNSIQRVLTVNANAIYEVEGKEAIIVDKKTLPLYSLNTLLKTEASASAGTELHVIVLKKGSEAIALLVDKIIGEREIVIKSLQAPLSNIPMLEGGTLFGNNQVILILNPTQLIEHISKTEPSTKILAPTTNKDEAAPIHVLVADDSITTRTLEKNILESHHYKVTLAVNGQEAWDILQKQKFSLLITDVSMPIMNGFELTDRVKRSKELHDMPVIIVTSLENVEDKQRGVEVGANAYVVKNEFESSELLSIIEQLI